MNKWYGNLDFKIILLHLSYISPKSPPLNSPLVTSKHLRQSIFKNTTRLVLISHNVASIFKSWVQGNQYLRYYTPCACILSDPWHISCKYNTIRIHDTTRIVLTCCHFISLSMVGPPPTYVGLGLFLLYHFIAIPAMRPYTQSPYLGPIHWPFVIITCWLKEGGQWPSRLESFKVNVYRSNQPIINTIRPLGSISSTVVVYACLEAGLLVITITKSEIKRFRSGDSLITPGRFTSVALGLNPSPIHLNTQSLPDRSCTGYPSNLRGYQVWLSRGPLPDMNLPSFITWLS